MTQFKTVLQSSVVRAHGARGLAAMVRRMLAALALAALAAGCASHSEDLVPDKNMMAVSVGAVGHYGGRIGIPDFYLNGHRIGNAMGWGGGGAGMCCVLLPRKITKPVMVKVNWTTCDISAIKFVNNQAVDPNARCKDEEHEATVPVHFAVEPGDSSGLYVHFLPGHRVEVWVSWPWPSSTEYPGPPYPRGPAPPYVPLSGEKPQSSTANSK